MRLSPLENKFTVSNPCIVKYGPLNHTFLPIAFDFADCNVIKMRKKIFHSIYEASFNENFLELFSSSKISSIPVFAFVMFRHVEISAFFFGTESSKETHLGDSLTIFICPF